MIEYFPKNYVWNLSVNIALAMGANPGEVDIMCRRLVEASERAQDGGTDDFLRVWCEQADRLVELAEEDLAQGRRLSAGTKLGRAATYYLTAERMQSVDHEPRKAIYRRTLDCFARFIELNDENCEVVEFPYEGKTLKGLFVSAGPKAPCMALFNGLDSTKEMIYGCGWQQALARRGVSSIAIDQPGVGEALRLQGLPAIVEAERWAGAAIDYLRTRADVDEAFIGCGAWSLGGYYAPRAAAMEPRFKLCVAWGANYDWGEMQHKRLAGQGDQPVPHYWKHVQWVWGKTTLEEFMDFVPQVTLAPVIERIRVPFLVAHGSNDRQIPVAYAHTQYEKAVNSPKRELKLFTPREGGIEHCSADNQTNARDYLCDWIAETFAEQGAAGIRL